MLNSTKKSKTQKFPFWLLFTCLFYLLGFITATLYDLSINQSVYSPHNPFAIFMEAFGWYPAFLIAIFYFFLLATNFNKTYKPWQIFISYSIAITGLAIMCWDSLRRLIKRNWLTGFFTTKSFVFILFVAIIGFLLFLLANKAPIKIKPKLTFWGFWGTVYLAANQVFIYLIKTLWQRARFDDMLLLSKFSNFTPWYQFSGNGGSSFPSGHTANAAGIFVLIILCDLFPSWNKKRKLIYALIWLYIFLMAFSRVLIGRHFMSDTLAASGIMAILFFIIRRTPLYKNQLHKINNM